MYRELSAREQSHFALREGRYKLILRLAGFNQAHWRAESVELYDLAADPGEQRNLATEYPELTARLVAQARDRIDYGLAGLERKLSPDDAARLRALGYLE